jgi:hypothetical protein
MCVAMFKYDRIVNVCGKEITNGIINVFEEIIQCCDGTNYQTPSICPLSPTSYMLLPRAGYVLRGLQGILKPSFERMLMFIRYSTNAPSLHSYVSHFDR